VLDKCGGRVRGLMLENSWIKCLTSVEPDIQPPLSFRYKTPRRTWSWESIKRVWYRTPTEGLLSSYPIVRLVENHLSANELRALMFSIGSYVGVNEDAHERAFGPGVHGIAISGLISYSDACTLSKRTVCEAVVVERSMYI
jgi:hypothetical protein